MVGVGYGKGAELPDDEVRWLTPEEIEERQARGETIRFFDARDPEEHAKGTLPGAESLAQTKLMFAKEVVQPLMDDLLRGAGGADDLVFFANTAGPNWGMSAGREVFVMAYLKELGVPMERMARLRGGYSGWKASGRPSPAGGVEKAAMGGGGSGFSELLDSVGLGHLNEPLAALTLEAAAAAVVASRPQFLAMLKDDYHVTKLADRQALCNSLSKAVREGRVTGM